MSLIPFYKPQFPSELRITAITWNKQIPSIELKSELIDKITGCKIDATALLDSGAEGIIINDTFATRHHLNRIPIKKPFPVRNVMGWVTHYTTQKLRIHTPKWDSHHEETTEFYIMDIGDHRLAKTSQPENRLGRFWSRTHTLSEHLLTEEPTSKGQS